MEWVLDNVSGGQGPPELRTSPLLLEVRSHVIMQGGFRFERISITHLISSHLEMRREEGEREPRGSKSHPRTGTTGLGRAMAMEDWNGRTEQIA
jgi:hypothetical protein